MGNLCRETYPTTTLCPVQTWQIPIKEETTIPETKAEAGRIVQCTALYRPKEGKLEQRRLHFAGTLEFTVLYREEKENAPMHSLTVSIPIEEERNLESVLPEGADARYDQEFEVENVRASLVHSRKIRLNALVETRMRIIIDTDQTVIVGAEDEEKLQLRYLQRPVRQRVVDRRETFTVRDVIPVQDADPNIDEVLWWDARMTERRYRLTQDRLEIQGEVRLGVFYRGRESGEIVFRESAIPCQSGFDLPGVREGQIPQVTLRIGQWYLRTAQDDDGEERLLEAEIVMEAHIQIYQEETRSLVTDAYHLEKSVNTEQAPCSFQHFLYHAATRFETEGRLEVRDADPPMEKILYASGRARIDDCLIEADQVLLEGVVYATVFGLTSSERDPFVSVTEPIPFRQTLAVPGARPTLTGGRPGQSFQTEIWVDTVTAALRHGRTIDVRIDGTVEGFGVEEESVPVLRELTTEETEPIAWEKLPSAVLCFVTPEQSLWEVAKRLHIPEERIERLNESTVLATR